MLELNIFDTIGGLPVHALVVHFAVVLLPLSSLALLAEAVRPAWRRRYGFVTFACLTVGVLAALVSKLSGEQLATHVGRPAAHATWATVTLIVSALLWLVSGAQLWLTRKTGTDDARRSWAPIAPWATAVLSVATLAAAVAVGHTGTQAVWAGRVTNTAPVVPAAPTSSSAAANPTATQDTASPSGSATGTASASQASSSSATSTSGSSYTLAQVATHNSASSCWAAIEGSVYDLTGWINQHPGGTGHILALCGTDGTSAFEAQHSGDQRPAEELATFKIGTLG